MRDTAGKDAGVPLALAVVPVWAIVDGEVVCVCADTIAAAAKTKTARDGFFTSDLVLGEKESFLILLYGEGLPHGFKEQEGTGLW